MSTELGAIFEPITINSLQLDNRLVMPPMATSYADSQHKVTDRLIDYYQARARGGVGLQIIEYTAVTPRGRSRDHQVAIYDDKFIPDLKRLTSAIHDAGGKTAIQLHHAGITTSSEVTGETPVGPSPKSDSEGASRALSISEIKAIVEAFAAGAQRAKKAGFDAVEIHGAHGYLLAQFMSDATNKRTDQYGGSLEGYLKFPIEVIEAVREVVGPDFPILFRMEGEEAAEQGRTIEESKRMVPALVDAGVDCMHISGGQHVIAPMGTRQGYNVHAAGQIKSVVDVPVIAVGRICSPEVAAQILNSGDADLIAMGRALIADPDLPEKARDGRLDDVRLCIGCGHCQQSPAYCTQNPFVGYEKETPLKPSEDSKEVLVIGGGPAGLEAARIAALRGHDVVLYEKELLLGGQARIATLGPDKRELQNVVDYRVGQLRKLGVDIVLGTEVDSELIKDIDPSVVIVSTGSDPIVPEIPGIQRSNVVTAREVFSENAYVGPSAVVLGGGLVGSEVAAYLGEKGVEVTIVEMQDDIAVDVPGLCRTPLLDAVSETVEEVLVSTRVESVVDEGVSVRTGSEEFLVNADTVVLAAGSTSRNRLTAMSELSAEVHVIGDAHTPGKIYEAVRAAAEVAQQI